MKKILFGFMLIVASLNVNANDEISIKVKDGNSEVKQVQVVLKYDSEEKIKLQPEQINELVSKTSDRVKIGLKNEYSYIPRSVVITQSGISFLVAIRYTAENSYGANVVSTFGQNFVLKEDGTFR